MAASARSDLCDKMLHKSHLFVVLVNSIQKQSTCRRFLLGGARPSSSVSHVGLFGKFVDPLVLLHQFHDGLSVSVSRLLSSLTCHVASVCNVFGDPMMISFDFALVTATLTRLWSLSRPTCDFIFRRS